MNRTELIHFLRNPNELSKNNMKELNHVIREYPYFLSARVLLAKRCKMLELSVADKLVSSASIYATDRILLKKYINGKLFYLHPPIVEEEAHLLNDETLSETNKKIPELPTDGLDTMLEELQRDMKNLKNSRQKFAEVQSSLNFDNTSNEEVETADDSLLDFDDEMEKAIQLAIEKATQKKAEISPKKTNQKEVIDKFLEKTPSIKPFKNENKSIEDLAKMSSQWNDEVASEYLAEIYLNQGNKSRAIEIYNSLSLKFPEKKPYFADLISKIK